MRRLVSAFYDPRGQTIRGARGVGSVGSFSSLAPPTLGRCPLGPPMPCPVGRETRGPRSPPLAAVRPGGARRCSPASRAISAPGGIGWPAQKFARARRVTLGALDSLADCLVSTLAAWPLIDPWRSETDSTRGRLARLDAAHATQWLQRVRTWLRCAHGAQWAMPSFGYLGAM